MNISLENKRAVVCGSTQGIGLAIAKELAGLGATCTLLARNEDTLRKAIAALPVPQLQQHSFVVADFTDTDAVQKAIAAIVSTQHIHILINNTGGPPPGSLQNAPAEDLNKAFQMHLINNQQLVQAVLPGMKKEAYGRIINIISTSVKIPIPNLGVSNTIRAATAAWAKTLSLELGQFGITVNNILPGYTETGRLGKLITTNAERQGISEEQLSQQMQQQIPARRFGTAEEIAAVAAFLASPAAAYVNGVSLPVDGGNTGAF